MTDKSTLRKFKISLLNLLLILFLINNSFAQGPLSLVPTTSATHTATSSGNWTNSATWGGNLPNDGAKVLIPVGITVTIDGLVADRIKTIRIDGTLKFSTNTNTELKVETMISSHSGKLEIGTQSNPVQANVTAKLLFIDDGPINMTWDPKRFSRGAVLMGPVEMYGEQKTSWLELAVQPSSGNTSLSLSKAPLNWKIGDKLIVAGTNPNVHTSDEVVTIQSINANSVTLTSPLVKDHLAPVTDVAVHVANSSRNIQISSENKTAIKQRGHIMFMHNLNVNINFVEFNGLGRTNKRISLDDTEFPDLEEDGSFVPGPGNNIRGRYSVHFHRGGSDPSNAAAHVEGCSVTDDPGWAYVNHSAKVDFIHNVSYNIVGGAFQTEAGDETGSFIGNIAIRTVNPDDPMMNPSDTNALVDLRENFQDYAWQGDAFWIHGGGVKVDSNIASGVSGHAFIYWPEGLIEANSGMMRGDKSRVPNNHLLSNVTQFDIWWIPIASAKGNTAYSATKGLSTYYLHTSFLDPDDPADAVSQSYRNTLNSTFEGYTMWAMRQKMLDFNYTENITVKDSRFIGHGAANLVGIDANHFHNMEDMIFENITIEGFDIGFDVPSNGRVKIKDLTMNNQTDFRIRETQWQKDFDSIGGFGRDMRIENINYLNTSGTRIKMAPNFSLLAEVQDGLDDEDPKNRFWFLLRDKIVLNYGPFQNSRLYFDQQAAAFIPITPGNDSIHGSDDGIPPQFVNKSNQELQNMVNSSLGGELLPSSAVVAPGVIGGKATNVVISVDEKEANGPAIYLYPNPASDRIYLQFESPEKEALEAQIWSLSGSLISSTTLNLKVARQEVTLSDKNIPPGTYILKINSPSNTWTHKFIRL